MLPLKRRFALLRDLVGTIDRGAPSPLCAAFLFAMSDACAGVSRGVRECPLVVPPLNWFWEDVVTEIADVDVSGPEAPSGLLFGDNVPDVDGTLYPPSDPLADAAELGAPPALADPNEYIDETDIRFVSMSGIDGRDRRAASGNCECFGSSAMTPGDSLGVSKSPSTAISSLLPRLLSGLLACTCVPDSDERDNVLYDEEVRVRDRESEGGGGMEILARSACVIVVPGSAYRPF